MGSEKSGELRCKGKAQKDVSGLPRGTVPHAHARPKAGLGEAGGEAP